MGETLRSKFLRWGFNLFPAYRGSGARLTHLSGDFSRVRIKLPLNWRTRNYVNTIFGGSMYAAVDPIYMLMLIHILGPDYIVWDKSATIRFRKPGRATLFAEFHVPDHEAQAIRDALKGQDKIDREYRVTLADKDGVAHAEFTKVVHVRRKNGGTGDTGG
ncbi:MAG: DUF4442 domain-containing protein [Nitrospirota bacterium]|nr:DUF4442 domain-containing protein [Nitrospirota bacterium]